MSELYERLKRDRPELCGTYERLMRQQPERLGMCTDTRDFEFLVLILKGEATRGDWQKAREVATKPLQQAEAAVTARAETIAQLEARIAAAGERLQAFDALDHVSTKDVVDAENAKRDQRTLGAQLEQARAALDEDQAVRDRARTSFATARAHELECAIDEHEAQIEPLLQKARATFALLVQALEKLVREWREVAPVAERNGDGSRFLARLRDDPLAAALSLLDDIARETAEREERARQSAAENERRQEQIRADLAAIAEAKAEEERRRKNEIVIAPLRPPPPPERDAHQPPPGRDDGLDPDDDSADEY